MAYSRTYWVDDAWTPQHTFYEQENRDGTVTLTKAGRQIQKGTNQSAANFNNLEEGVFASYVAAVELANGLRLVGDKAEALEGFVAEATLTNNLAYPFNSTANTPHTVGLSGAQTRNTKNYTVTVEVEPPTASVKDVIISDKMVNGFKVSYTGSAKSVKIRCFVQGGK